MKAGLKIGELARSTGLTTKAIRYYELMKLLPEPRRTESGYRLYSADEIQRLHFIKKAKRLGLSLEDIRDILTLHDSHQPTCVHVLALMDQKLTYLDDLTDSLYEFREELAHLREKSAGQLPTLSQGPGICGIIDQAIHAKGELALTWLEGRMKARGEA